MPLIINDQIIMERFKKYLKSDETEFYYVLAQREPYAALLGVSLLLWLLGFKYYLIGLTNKRLLIMQITITCKEKKFEAVEFTEIDKVEITDIMFFKRLTDRNIRLKLTNGEKYKFKILKTIIPIKKQGDNMLKITNFLNNLKKDKER